MAFQMIIRIAVRAPLNFFMALFMVFYLSAEIGWYMLLVIVLLAIAVGILIKRAGPVFNKMFKMYDSLNEEIQENITGIRPVKSFVREDYEIQRFNKRSQDIYSVNRTAELMMILNQPFVQLAMYACVLIVSFVGAHQIVNGTMMDGTLMLCLRTS